MKNNRHMKKMASVLVILLLILGTPINAYADSNHDNRECISRVTHNIKTDINDIFNIAINQAVEDSNNVGENRLVGSCESQISDDLSDTGNNGIMAKQLIEERAYSDGTLEKDYVVNNLALEDKTTGEVYTYANGSLYRSISYYNVVAVQTVNFTVQYTETGVPNVYSEIRIRVNNEESYVNYTTTGVAYITHGIKADLLLFPYMLAYTTNVGPGNGTVYTVYATNNTYYRDNSGTYETFLNVQTTNNNYFELHIDLLILLHG